MRTPISEYDPPQAHQVCISCKKRKRKCNKARPKCSSCLERNLNCEYSAPRKSSDSTSVLDQLPNSFFVDDGPADAQSIDIPTILFLDPTILRNGYVEISRTANLVPEPILRLLGDLEEIEEISSRFFGHIHLWMPFISKKRFYEIHLRPSFQSRPDIVLLLLSLKLITTLPPTQPRNPRTSLYKTIKHFYLELEGSSTLSILILQAGVLLAFYELGHAIYPAAYLSIGACARYAHALGINASGKLNKGRVVTLVEVEERRRVWWAIVILDRFVSVGCPGRPFATANPILEDYLPVDDKAWDEGIIRPEDYFTLSSPMSSHMSKFALLCQAARLLGQVLDYVSSDHAVHDDVWIQLDRTLQSMTAASLKVDAPDYSQITFVYSALVALYTPWIASSSSNEADNVRSQRAKVIIEQITETIKENLMARKCFFGVDPEDMSPWGLFFAYRISVSHMRRSRENPDSLYILKNLKEVFMTIDSRWNAAGVYLQLLEAQEVMENC
ncbi:putative fungal-specific transcription factor [Talaromyces proteolyticus]|uniref:Fungal-specific transcription factor n=1 Tax=Talaromyces proteolyticus TaxID=1131652 RepID=A0AAD4KX55_9EURO|nr:putative fungal-specific transcription factor [Talaromyces proteolyticus]KAH8703165.1 putative fungal-specific transcription factor [Talaromyces proteolyticus]